MKTAMLVFFMTLFAGIAFSQSKEISMDRSVKKHLILKSVFIPILWRTDSGEIFLWTTESGEKIGTNILNHIIWVLSINHYY